MQTRFACLVAVGEVDIDRADRAEPACSHAAAVIELEVAPRVGSIAGIGKDGCAPFRGDLIDQLCTQHRSLRATDNGSAFFYAQGFVAVAAHALVAAGTKQQVAGNRPPVAAVNLAGLAAKLCTP